MSMSVANLSAVVPEAAAFCMMSRCLLRIGDGEQGNARA